MSNYEEAEVLENGGVIIRYYFGKTVLIPAAIVEREAISITRADEVIKRIDYKRKIALSPRRFVDGGI
jgi:hypothetical protein